jgi:hypothetical protein
MSRRIWIGVFLCCLGTINYMDRIALSIAAKPIAQLFGLSPVWMGYLFSSFIWSYTLFSCQWAIWSTVSVQSEWLLTEYSSGLWRQH